MSTEDDNRRRFAPDRQGVYEVWYTTWNDPRTGQGFWLRFITEAPEHGSGGVPGFGEELRGELWFARFDPKDPRRTFGIHKRFRDVVSKDVPFRLTIAGCELRHDGSFGELSGDGHDVRWDLRWEPAARTLRHFPDVMYKGEGRSPTMVHSPNPRVPMSGTLLVDGEEIALDKAIAGQSHIWAHKHSISWTWAHCTDFEGVGDGLFELIGSKVKRGPITTPNLVMVALDFDGEQHRLNQFRHVAWNRGKWTTGRVEVTAKSADIKIEAELTCAPEDLILAPYVDPDGTEVFCANTEIGSAWITVSKRSGLRWKEYRRLEAKKRMHFETGGPVRDPLVARPHVLVT